MKEYIRPVGQDKLKSFFDNIIHSDRMSHAYIFEGASGIGKKTMAKYFSLVIMCQNHNICMECSPCACTASGTNPDVVWVDKGDKATISVDKIRDIIKEIYIKPKMCQRRIFIIDQAHLMNDASQNALLKVIENPPDYALFILLTENKNMLLPTVLSRSVIVKIPPLSTEEIMKLSKEESRVGAVFCKGNPGKYLELLQDEEFVGIREEFFDVIMKLFSKDEYGIYKILDFFDKNKDRRSTIFELLSSFFEDVMLTKTNVRQNMTNADKRLQIIDVANNITDKMSVNLVGIILDADREMGKYGAFSISMQAMLIRMWEEIHG